MGKLLKFFGKCLLIMLVSIQAFAENVSENSNTICNIIVVTNVITVVVTNASSVDSINTHWNNIGGKPQWIEGLQSLLNENGKVRLDKLDVSDKISLKNFMDNGLDLFRNNDPSAMDFIYGNMLDPAAIGADDLEGYDNYIIVDRWNTSGIEDGSINHPFSSLDTAFEFTYKRWHHGFFKVVRHFAGETVVYGGITNNIPSNAANISINTYRIQYGKFLQIGLTGQSIHLYPWTYRSDESVSSKQNNPLRILLRAGSSTDHFIRNYGGWFHIGGDLSIDPKSWSVLEIGFEKETGGWYTGEWGISMHGNGISFANVRVMGGTFVISGINFHYDFIVSSDFSENIRNLLLQKSRISSSTYGSDGMMGGVIKFQSK